MSDSFPLVILGSGPAGCSAAVYAARAGLSPVLISGSTPGGQLMSTTDVENWPGDAEGLTGPGLMTRLIHHAQQVGTDWRSDTIERVDLQSRPFTLYGSDAVYQTHALIIATGASALYLGLPAETRFLGKGVSACATCDGFFYRNRRVFVIGGGNTAVEEALYLAGLAQHVTLVHRRNTLRAEQILQDRLFAAVDTGKITCIWDHTVADILGDDAAGVTGIVLQHTETGAQTTCHTHGVFIAIGHRPNTALFEGQLAMDQGYIQLAPHRTPHAGVTATQIPGVFACGDVADPLYRQAITSAGSGCQAALDAHRYLSAHRS